MVQVGQPSFLFCFLLWSLLVVVVVVVVAAAVGLPLSLNPSSVGADRPRGGELPQGLQGHGTGGTT